MPGEPSTSRAPHAPSDQPAHRYNAALAGRIEARWQDFWQQHGTFRAPNPGEPGFDAMRPKKYILDMFPYPSGVGLHVGHPLGYIATDIFARYQRMTGHNVLHAMGYDAFGLPAEQYAIQTGTHPRITTERNIQTMRAQLRRLGLAHDDRRSVATTDPAFYRWTQWIFLRLYHSWYDADADRARPVEALAAALDSGEVATRSGGPWRDLSPDERRAEIDSRRLAYVDELPVNWCPQLGTVLANEEVTADGRSERGNFPVYRRPLRQWMLRITAYAERLLRDLDRVDWPEPIRMMQRNWIGRSEGAFVDFAVQGGTAFGGTAFGGTAFGGTAFGGTAFGGTAFGGTALRAVSSFPPQLQEVIDSSSPFWCKAEGFVPRDPYPPGSPSPGDLLRSLRDLPHLELPGATYFVTWRTVQGRTLSPKERNIVADSLRFWDGTRCRVYALTVMPDHVHWIVQPSAQHDLGSLVGSVKKHSALLINRGEGVSGPVWQSERFDHIVRDGLWFAEFLRYVLQNPVEARASSKPSSYPWSFVSSSVALAAHPPKHRSESGATPIRVFTTRPDTLFGATYVVLSPEHPLVDQITTDDWADAPNSWRGRFPGAPETAFDSPRAAVAAYREFARAKTDVQRSEAKAKTGVFTGASAVNPVTGEPVPVFIADYVLTGYGTGAIMAVPAHDERDFEFASALGLPIRDVVYPAHIAAMKFFAENACAPEQSESAWFSVLADLLGLVTSAGSTPARFPEVLTTVRVRRGIPPHDPAACILDVEGPGKAGGGEVGRRRGLIKATWLDAVEELGAEGFEAFRERFASASHFAGTGGAYTGSGFAVNSRGPNLSIDGLPTDQAKRAVVEWLEANSLGRGAVTYKLRDWLFSRQRYWGEPFPIVYDEMGRHHALPDSMLPVELPPLDNFTPESSDDPDAPPRPPLGRAHAWSTVELDLGDGPKRYTRELNTMPNWAGSCWYYLRYLDPENPRQFCGPEAERYWMAGPASGTHTPPLTAHPPLPVGGVDLYVGGVEHAVLHLLYARFWHKVLFDLGHVSTPEPFQKLFNQGYIQAAAYTDDRGIYVEAAEVEERGGKFFHHGRPVTREFGKMGKSLKNAVAPDVVCAEYGCDTMRIYEMSMGPLEASKPWNTRDIAGSYRFLQRVWRNLIDEDSGELRTTNNPADAATLRLLHKTIKGVRRDMDQLGFNTVVAKLIELNNHLGTLDAVPREIAAPFILMLAPLAPHIAEELWQRLRGPAPGGKALGGTALRAVSKEINQDGHRSESGATRSIAFEPYPIADDALAADDVVEVPVQIAGKVRARISIAAGLDARATEAAAMADPRVAELLGGKPVKKVIVVPGRMVNIVV